MGGGKPERPKKMNEKKKDLLDEIEKREKSERERERENEMQIK